MSIWRGEGARDVVTYADALTSCSVNIVEADNNQQIADMQWERCDRNPADDAGKEKVKVIADARIRWREDARHWRRVRAWYHRQVDAGLGATPIKVSGFISAVARGQEDDDGA